MDEYETLLWMKRRGCFVLEDPHPGTTVPDGWIEIQRDDAPDHPEGTFYTFADDIDAGLWVSPAVRLLNRATGATMRPTPVLGGRVKYPTPDPWPGDSVATIVPVLDAIDAGLITDHPIWVAVAIDEGWPPTWERAANPGPKAGCIIDAGEWWNITHGEDGERGFTLWRLPSRSGWDYRVLIGVRSTLERAQELAARHEGRL